MEELFGTVERITFRNDENGFTVARLKVPRQTDLATILGPLPPLQPGERVSCKGVWKNNPSHGKQFEVQECKVDAPADIAGIEKYLSSGLIRGIGPAYAAKIVKKFGVKTLEIFENDPEKLRSIDGIGEKKLDSIVASWGAHKAIRDVMLFLQRYGITPAYAYRIFKVFGKEAVSKVEENPYCLAEHIPGMGFKMADKIAEKMGIDKSSSFRASSGIEYLLRELASDGHTCYPLPEFLTLAKETLATEDSLLEAALPALIATQKIVIEDEKIATKALSLAEKGIARELIRLKQGSSTLRKIDCEKAVSWVESQIRINLAPNQREAVLSSLIEKLHIITGGPGTGKSTITKAILSIFSQLTRKILLAAPTGRAAKRMSEITKFRASTIHSLLQYDFKGGGFRHNRENPLNVDLIIVDEASMIDTYLMYHLLKAIPDESHVIFVGDIHQLPSVGPGNVLKDMIESQTVPVTRLTKIFRQAAGSKIITNAHRINEGRFPIISPEENSDFFVVEEQEVEDCKRTICDLISKRLPEKYGFDPIEEIQLLSPMKRGPLGTATLNLALQEILNPQKECFSHMGNRFGVGDKVMQMKNNYSKEVYNGDIGRVTQIAEEVHVRFDDKEVIYTPLDLDELSLAYATSIHKYQGSEAPCIVVPIHTTHFVMLHRNLLYTAVTRGKKLVVLVGTPKAIAIAVGNDTIQKRHTTLKERLLDS